MTKRADRCITYLRGKPYGATVVEINAALGTTEARKIISEVISAGYRIDKIPKPVIGDKRSRCVIYKLVE